MVILLSQRNSKCEKEIIEILKKYGADHFSDKNITINKSSLLCVSIYKKTEFNLKNAVVIFTEKNPRFALQNFPISVIGVCEDNNKTALLSFNRSSNAVITCGTNNKNTVTISSFTNKNVLVTLQRSVIDIFGNQIEPCEFKIELTKKYSPFSVISSTIALILNGIKPQKF